MLAYNKIFSVSSEQYSDEELNELIKLSQEFPYFDKLQSVVVKTLFQKKLIGFDSALKKAATTVKSRAWLYDEVYNSNQIETQDLHHKVSTNKNESVKEELKGEDSVVAEINLPKVETSKNSLENVEIILKEIRDELSQLAQPPIEVVEIQNENPLETSRDEIIDLTINESAPPVLENQVKDFSYWLKVGGTLKVNDELQIMIDEVGGSLPEIKPKPAKENLVDKFIREEPKLAPKKGVFYSPDSKAKLSLEEDEELVTETLAHIYELQGNFKKAIRAYETLSLKFPEKSAYFASLIEKAKQLNSRI